MLPTQGAANPALTIMALAARAADRLATRQVRAGLTDAGRRAMTAPATAHRRGSPLRCTGSRPPDRRPTAPCTWDATTAVTVTCTPASGTGLGWTYSTRPRPRGDHRPPRRRRSPAATPSTSPACWSAMHRACRNLGTRGLVMQAISAVDIALWDLKARLLDVPLATLFGPVPRPRSRSTGPAGSPP